MTDDQALSLRDGTLVDPEPLRNHEQVAEHLGGDIAKRIYKDTACGAWVDLKDPRCLIIGTIVEGSDVEPIVRPRRLWYPFLAPLLDQAIAAVEQDASDCWQHVNECDDDCTGDSCGYSRVAGSDVVDLNQPDPEDEHHDEDAELRKAALDHRGRP